MPCPATCPCSWTHWPTASSLASIGNCAASPSSGASRPSGCGSSTTTWVRNTSAMCRTATSRSSRTPRAPASSRLIAYSAAMRRSRSRADSAWARMRTARLLITRATTSMTAKVTRYWVSETAKVK